MQHAQLFMKQAVHVHPSPMDAWHALFPDNCRQGNVFSSSYRHHYAPADLQRLRHTKRSPLLSTDRIFAQTSSGLRTFPFRPSDDLTADVLLSAAESSLTFSDLRLSPSVVTALKISGFTRPSPVQLRTLPRARLGSDIIAHAKSGTGKTLAYVLATLDAHLVSNSSDASPPGALIITPTREIATQVCALIKSLGARLSPIPTVASLVGGTDERADARMLGETSPSIIVGTPGRVRSLANSASLPLHAIEILVLDEADRLLEPSFAQDVRAICDLLPASRQTLAFSATFSPWLRQVLLEIMNAPAYITCEGEMDVEKENKIGTENQSDDVISIQKSVLLGVHQGKLVVPTDSMSQKLKLLLDILGTWKFKLCIVFVKSRNDVTNVEQHVKAASIKCRGINGGVKQNVRMAIMAKVRKGEVNVLISTDLLARGVDFPACDLVVHLDAPAEVATYLHRVGRAGRFGGQGRSIIMCGSQDDAMMVEILEQKLGFAIQEVQNLSQHEFLGKSQQQKGSGPDHSGENEGNNFVGGYESVNVSMGAQVPMDALPLALVPSDVGSSHTVSHRSIPSKKETREKAQNRGHIGHATTAEAESDVAKKCLSNDVSPGKNDRCLPVEIQMSVKLDEEEHIVEKGTVRSAPLSNQGIETSLDEMDIERTEPGPEGPGNVVTGDVRKRRRDVEIEANELMKRRRTEAVDKHMLQSHNVGSWEQFAQKAHTAGYDEGYSRAYRIAFELGQRMRK